MPNSRFATPLRPELPDLRSNVMSSLPPPLRNRLPLAKSAPPTSAETNAGISPGSADPSASNMTMTSPVAAVKPQAIALPLPLRVWVITRAQGSVRRAAATVLSVELPSTTITSCTAGRTAAIAGSTISRFRASLRVGTITDTAGLGDRRGAGRGRGRRNPSGPSVCGIAARAVEPGVPGKGVWLAPEPVCCPGRTGASVPDVTAGRAGVTALTLPPYGSALPVQRRCSGLDAVFFVSADSANPWR